LVADNGKVGDYSYYLRVVEWCFYYPHMQVTAMTMQVSAEELWGGVEFKLDEARFFLNEMSVDIRPLRDRPGSSAVSR